MIKKIIITVILDMLIFLLFVFSRQPEPSEAILEVFIIPLLFIINLVAGLIFLSLRKRETGFALLINAVLAPIFFGITWNGWDDYYHYTNYTIIHVHDKGTRYVITIYKKTNDYDIAKTLHKGASEGTASGHYTIKGNTFYLADGSRVIEVNSKNVIGFPLKTDTLKIDTDSYYY